MTNLLELLKTLVYFPKSESIHLLFFDVRQANWAGVSYHLLHKSLQFLGDLKDGIITEDGVTRNPPYIYLIRNLIKSKYFVAFVLTMLTMIKTQLYFQEGVMPSPAWIPSVFAIPLIVTFVLWIKSFFSQNK